ncbi:MAG: DNA polymerase I [Oscillospiraceae bacterium]|nr:DNA polymerase I [Oscillospiraceae bacterium]
MKLLAIDGNSIMNRAFYGIKQLSTKDGVFTNAVTGFMNIYFKAKGELSPDACAVAFDLREPTFRHKADPAYKANRHGMPDELAMQMPYIKQILAAMGVTVLEYPGFEADDILGTLASAAGDGDHVYILTGDRDTLQLIKSNVTVLLHTTREVIRFTPEKFSEVYGGLTPIQLIDVKGLMGDTSDNIKGVKGIGEKTALGLIQTYGSIDALYKALDAGQTVGTKSVETKLSEGRESAEHSRFLATIVTDVPLQRDISAYAYREQRREELAQVLSRLEMYKLLDKLKIKPVPVVQEDAPHEPIEKMDYTRVYTAPDGDYAFIFSGNILYTSCGGKVYRTDDRQEILRILSMPCKKTAYGAKAAYRLCFENGITLENVVADAEIAGYLLDSNSSDYTIQTLCSRFGAYGYAEMEEFADICALKGLCTVLARHLERLGGMDLYLNVELPLTETLASMEYYGVAVDRQGILEFGDSLISTIERLKTRIYMQAGKEFNISSPKQLSEVLFTDLGLPAGKKTKTGYSTDADVLEDLESAHPIVHDILTYRQYTKLLSTYVEGLTKMIAPDGRIHTSFNQTETRTGRISSAEPNLQNIPVRTELGRNMRKFFVAGEGNVLVDGDYSQIELRILAAMSGDKNMQEAFLSGGDIHTKTASQVFGVPLDEVTREMRTAAKAVNFGIVYGISAFSLAKDIGITVTQADRYKKNYLANFPGVRDFLKESVESAAEKGYSLTLFGRRRYIPELSNSNRNVQAFGRRVAMNAPVQGSAADIIKIAMVRVYKRLRDEKLNAHLVLQVHDELIIEADKASAERAAQILAEEMPGAAKIAVPLVTDIKTGTSWAESH